MRIAQDLPQFAPITITLETREEAEALWEAVRRTPGIGGMSTTNRAFCINLSNWFSNEARL